MCQNAPRGVPGLEVVGTSTPVLPVPLACKDRIHALSGNVRADLPPVGVEDIAEVEKGKGVEQWLKGALDCRWSPLEGIAGEEAFKDAPQKTLKIGAVFMEAFKTVHDVIPSGCLSGPVGWILDRNEPATFIPVSGSFESSAP